MRWVLVTLISLLVVLQYRLWLAEGGLAERERLQRQVEQAEQENTRLRERNDALAREVLELQSGNAVVERRAREELGLIKEGEVYFQFLEDGAEAPGTPAPGS